MTMARVEQRSRAGGVTLHEQLLSIRWQRFRFRKPCTWILHMHAAHTGLSLERPNGPRLQLRAEHHLKRLCTVCKRVKDSGPRVRPCLF